MSQTADTRISPVVRWTFVLVALVLLAGLSLFFAPGLVGPKWPWPLPPFNARFLGAVYLAEMVAVAFTLATNSWAVARLTIPQAFAFTVVVLLASVVEYEDFDFGRPITWAWFIIYSIPMLLTGYYTWAYRNRQPSGGPVSGFWRGYLLAQGLALGLYGLGSFIAPLAFNGFWPWAVDAFHGRVYSGLFITGAVGSFMLARVASRLELITLGMTQAVLGVAAITGAAIVDASLKRVDWGSPGVLAWIAGFAILAVSGAGMIAYARGRR